MNKYQKIKPNTNLYLNISEVFPTQVNLGMKEVAHKIKLIKNMSTQEFDQYLELKITPVVIGPGGKIYVVDHHHHIYSLIKSEKKQVYVHILSNWSSLSVKEFWHKMVQKQWVYLYDQGNRISVRALPGSFKDMGDDPFRSLAWSVREMGGFEKVDQIPFFEFAWANFYKTYLTKQMVIDQYSIAQKAAYDLTKSKAAKKLPGYKGS